jgi:hypothetical protein
VYKTTIIQGVGSQIQLSRGGIQPLLEKQWDGFASVNNMEPILWASGDSEVNVTEAHNLGLRMSCQRRVENSKPVF